jgi:hypothetical protein
MAGFMQSSEPASSMVTGMGEVIERAFNLKGEPVGPRIRSGPTVTGAHYGNTDAEGNYVVFKPPRVADWFYQSLCSAHLEQKHQVRHVSYPVERKQIPSIYLVCVPHSRVF